MLYDVAGCGVVLLGLSSFGAVGFGWFRDFFRLPAYVRMANKDWKQQEV